MYKICTTIEQSKKLLSLNVKPSTADMYYSWIGTTYLLHAESYNEIIRWKKEYAKKHNHPSVQTSIIPCWSLAALLNVLPNSTNVVKEEADTENEKYMCTVGIKDDIISTFADNPVNACYEMIIKLHEQEIL